MASLSLITVATEDDDGTVTLTFYRAARFHPDTLAAVLGEPVRSQVWTAEQWDAAGEATALLPRLELDPTL